MAVSALPLQLVAVVALSAVNADLILPIVIASEVLPPAVIVKEASVEDVAAVNKPEGLLARLVAVVAVVAFPVHVVAVVALPSTSPFRLPSKPPLNLAAPLTVKLSAVILFAVSVELTVVASFKIRAPVTVPPDLLRYVVLITFPSLSLVALSASPALVAVPALVA